MYELTATIRGSYFHGSGLGVLTVYNPSLGFTTGGGWYTDPSNNYRYNFGFNAKILKSGQVQGSVLTIAHTPLGIYELKSTAMGGLVVAKDPTNTFWTATFSGKANYSVPPSQGLLWCGDRKCGDYRFTVYVEDRQEPGGGFDKFWIEVLNSPTATGGFANKPVVGFYMPQPANANAVTINNGNIQVPQPQSFGQVGLTLSERATEGRSSGNRPSVILRRRRRNGAGPRPRRSLALVPMGVVRGHR